MPEPPGARYRVVYSEFQRRAVRALGERAAGRGILGAYLDALRTMDLRLATDTARWGDPQNNLYHLGLTLFHRVEGPLCVLYAVDEQRRLVYLRSIMPMPNLGLEGPE